MTRAAIAGAVLAYACTCACGSGGARGPDAATIDASGGADAPIGDGDDFAHALPIVVGDQAGATGVIDPAGDVDYYTFDAPAGAWLTIDARRQPMTSPLDVDVTLYDATTAQRAHAAGGSGVELATRIATSGTQYVAVRDASGAGGPSRGYLVQVLPPDLTAAGVNVESESGDDAASAILLSTASLSMGYFQLYASYRDGADVDVYQLQASDMPQVLAIDPLPATGTDGDGATCDLGPIWITDASGATVIARLGGGSSSAPDAVLDTPLAAFQGYLLWTRHPASAAGANDFYVLTGRLGREKDAPEKEIGAGGNDTPALADSSGDTFPLAPFGTSYLGRVLTNFASATDVDYLAIDLPAPLTVTIRCQAATIGAGVIGYTAELRDAADGVIASAAESATSAAQLGPIVVPAGHIYLRLAATGLDPTITGAYSRCAASAN